MRIGMVTACYKPLINGVTQMVSLYKQQLQALGHDVFIFTLGEADPAGDEPCVIRSPAIPLGDFGYYVAPRYSTAAQKLLGQMEIIHCHHLFMSVDMAHRYGRCPIVYTNHTRYDLYTGSYAPLAQPAADAIMRQVWPEYTSLADAIIAPSASVRQILLDFGVYQPIEVIANGVDLRPFHTPPAPYHKTDLNIPATAVLLIYVGRLAAEKNLTILLRQFAIARQISPDLHLLLIGDGNARASLTQLAADLNISDALHFAGAIPTADIPNYLAAADIFVTASTSEVHPLSIIEAMAAGLPIAASASPGIVDTVQAGQTGFLVANPADGLAAAIVALSLNHERRQQMGHAAQQASTQFDITTTVARTLDLYQRLRHDRPDLKRNRAHGRWARHTPKLQPFVTQLARHLVPAEKADDWPEAQEG